MLSASKILLFVAVLILLGLLFGLEFGLILIATGVICFSSYEPFNENTYKIANFDDEDEFEQEVEQKEDEESDASESTHQFDDEDKYEIKRKNAKMSLWKPRTTPSGARVKISRPDSARSFPGKRTSLGSPLITPRQPIGSLTRGNRQAANGDHLFGSENSSLLGNLQLHSPSSHPVRRKTFETSSQSSLLSSPFLPRVKRAIGIGEANMRRQSNSPHRNNYGSSSGRLFSPQAKALPYPSASSPGWVPLVRLNRHEKPTLNENNSNMVHSPVTVKIAAPSSHRLNSSRLTVSQEELIEPIRKAPDKTTVLTALRERSRKRSIVFQDEPVTDVPDQQSKRRKQDDSTSSSSMASEPEFLAELTQNGYSNIPLHMVGLKRPATPTLDLENMANERNCKKSKTDSRNNSILSSLSSSRRGIAKEMSEFQPGEKRKPEEDCWDRHEVQISKISKTDTLIRDNRIIVSSTPVSENRPKPMIPDTEVTKRVVKETSTQSELPIVQEEIKPPQSLKKKLLFDAEKSAIKVKKGIYSSLNSPATKAATFDVTATGKDYDEDREAERLRAVDMLRDIQADEQQQEKEKTPDVIQVANSISIPAPNNLQQSVATAPSDPGKSNSLSSLLSDGNDQSKTAAGNPPSGFLSALAAAASVPDTVSSTGSTSSTTTAPTTTTTSSDAPQYSFKPVFPTSSTPSATTAPSTQAPVSGGFSLPQVNPQQTLAPSSTSSSSLPNASVPAQASTASGMFSFDSTKNAAPGVAVTTPVFGAASFPQSTSLQTTSTSSFSLPSQPQTTSQTTTLFQPSLSTGFGAVSSSLPKPTTAASPFTFGQVSSSTTSQSSAATVLPSVVAPSTGGFSFGGTVNNPPVTSSTNTTGGFSLDLTQSTSAAPSQQKAMAPASGFAFGVAAPQAKPAAKTQPPGTFSFGGAPSSTTPAAQAPSFTTTTASSMNQPPPTNAFNFSASASGASTPGSIFGSSQTSTASTQGSVFGSTQAPASSTQGSIFGSTQAPISTQGSIFGSTQSATTPTPGSMFGSTQVPTSFTQGSMFGSQQPATQRSVFGNQPSVTKASSAFGSGTNGFNFSVGSTPAFGQTTTTASSGFGSTTNPAVTSSTTPFQFGGANPTTAAAPSAFGSSGSMFSFGANSNTSGSASAFGAKPTSNLAVPAFTAAPTTQPSTFGQSSSSAFGSFGSKPATGVIGSSQSQAPVFGQTSTSAFGAPASGNAGTFAFGQSSNPAPSTPVKGFDFSASAGAGTPSLQFGSSNQTSGFSTPTSQTPAMNFGAATPGAPTTPSFGGGGGGFGTPTGGMFSVGSGATAARPRSRARRKGAKR